MRSRFGHLLIGLLLLATGGYFLKSAIQGWKPLWRQSTVAAHPAPAVTDALKSDLATEAAKLQAYGVLTNPALAQAEDAAPSAESNTAAAAPVSARNRYIEPVNRTPASGPNHFLHQRFSLRSYQGFAFEVPAHAIHPMLHGGFKSSAGGQNADIELLLLNQQEFDEFIHGRPGSATFTAEASDGGEVDWSLRSSVAEALKYYLVFRNPAARPRTTLVDANFTVNSD
jgi:hypothetical protein